MVRKVLIGLCLCFALLLSVQAVKAAPQTCGGFAGLKCPAGQACQYPTDKCNVADLSGVCVKVPETCPTKGPAVCGCDGKTYTNSCELMKAGVHPKSSGACPAAS